jgi:hypothetical protein
MKVKASELKTATVAYLYEDGHLNLVHEKNDEDAGRVRWVTIYQDVGIKPYFKGRLIIDKGALPFALHATRIEASEPDVKHGSENTKARGIEVQTISLFNGASGYHGFFISQFPGLISGSFTYQPDIKETFEEVKDQYTWGYADRIKAVYKAEVKEAA